MKKLTIVLAAALAMMAVGCQKNEELPEGGPASYRIAARTEIDLGEMMPGRSANISLYATTDDPGVREQLTATFAADPDAAGPFINEDTEVLPSDCYSFTVNDVVIDRYNKNSRTGKIKVTYSPVLEGGKTYILPLVVSEVTGSDNASADRTPIFVKFFAVSGSPDQPTGSGTKADPYYIYDAEGLMGMEEMIGKIGDAVKTADAYAAAAPTYFRLMNDIDMSGKDWTPINCDSPYDEKIDFDGNYKTISNLKYEGSKYGGMFGVLCGEVYNLNLIDAEITTNKDKSGLLCGYCGTGDIITGIVHGCKITGTLTVDNNTIGGVAGLMCGGEIYECDVDAKIKMVGNNRYYAGGIVGCGNKKPGSIHDCITRGEITSPGDLVAKTYNRNVAGIAGAFETPGYKIENCISLASVHCNAVAAGILGHANNNSWGQKAAADVDNYVIGCIAWNESITMDNSRTTSLLGKRDDYAMGGGCIMGWGCSENTLQNCWRKAGINFLVTCPDDAASAAHFKPFDQEDAGPGNPLKGIDCNFKDLWSSMYHGKAAGAGETASQVAKRIGWDENVWDLSGNVPALKNVKSIPSEDEPDKPAGFGTKSDPYMIYNIADLMAIADKAEMREFSSRDAYLAAEYTYFKLGNDIDLGGMAWTPIDLGMDKTKGKKIDLDGNKKTIKNFTVTGGEQVGLIKGLVGDIHDLKVEGATVTTTAKKAGILAGQASSGDNIFTNIYRCSVKGTLKCETTSDSKGEASLGGIVGQQCYGYIYECETDVTIELGGTNNGHYVGGIVGSFGKKGLEIRNCISKGNYAAASGSNAYMFGGILGCAQNEQNQIVNCISLATINCADMAGGIVAELNHNSDGGSDRTDIQDKTSLVSGCIAWNDAINAAGTKYGSGAIIGLGGAGEFKDCYRKADLPFSDSANTTAGAAATVASYNGKAAAADATASKVAKDLKWDETIWDLSGSVPALKNIK